MNIVVREVKNCGIFDAYTMDGKLLVRSGDTPLLMAARTLLALGTNPDEPLRMWHYGARFPSLTTTVCAAARLRIGSSNRGAAEFRKYAPNEYASCEL